MTLKKLDINNITTILEHKNSIKLVCANNYKKHYYPIVASFIVD